MMEHRLVKEGFHLILLITADVTDAKSNVALNVE